MAGKNVCRMRERSLQRFIILHGHQAVNVFARNERLDDFLGIVILEDGATQVKYHAGRSYSIVTDKRIRGGAPFNDLAKRADGLESLEVRQRACHKDPVE